MQNARGLRTNIQLLVASEEQRSFEASTNTDPSRSVQRLKELILALTLVMEAAEQSLLSEFKLGTDFYDNVSRFEILMIKRALNQADSKRLLVGSLRMLICSSNDTTITRVDLVMKEKLKGVPGRTAIVLFTDGVDTRSRRASYSSTVREAQAQGSLVYPIAYDTSREGTKRQLPARWTRRDPHRTTLPRG